MFFRRNIEELGIFMDWDKSDIYNEGWHCFSYDNEYRHSTDLHQR